ncbi:hypothetical protein L7F22_029449 [Adiantum nelumboides]|nr:hypothetical protein [Adiantum nelumboides]
MTFNVLVLLCGRLLLSAQQQPQQQKPGCLNQTCGGIKVSYPFKLENATDCPSFSSSFELECDTHTGYLLFKKANDTSGPLSLRVLALAADSIALDVTSIIIAMKLTPNGTYCDGELKALGLPPFPYPYVFSDESLVALVARMRRLPLPIRMEITPLYLSIARPASKMLLLGAAMCYALAVTIIQNVGTKNVVFFAGLVAPSPV